MKKCMLVLLLIILLLTGCHRDLLHEYNLDKVSAAAVMLPAPRAQVSTFSWVDTDGGLLSTIVSAGATIAKEMQAHEAQKKLDQAMQKVDIPEIIRFESLHGCCSHLDMKAVEDRDNADFTFVMKINKYGIDAQSWTSHVQFRIEVKVRFVDESLKRKVWERTIKEHMTISRSIFGLSDTVDSIITASVLGELTEEQMETGLTRLAEYAAGRIADRIYDDFLNSRERVE